MYVMFDFNVKRNVHILCQKSVFNEISTNQSMYSNNIIHGYAYL